MLSLFKKIFGKSATAPVVAAHAVVPAPPSTPMPTIEVAHLSLAAIVARFPDELKPLLMSQPDTAATVALPMPTILKQLPTGSVKMSLASLHRQAHGLIRPLPPGDKRSVEVPLAEVFRHVKPEAFRRRPDQRQIDVPDSGFNLFGDSTNPYAISPDDHILTVDIGDLEPDAGLAAAPAADPTAEAPRVLKMDDGLRAEFSNGAEAPSHPSETTPRALVPPGNIHVAAPAPAPTPLPGRAPVAQSAALHVPRPTGPTLTVSLSSLAGNWPEAVQTEIAAFDSGTEVILPIADVSAGLAKGRVSFLWKQIHSWLEPDATTPSAVPGDTVLLLPLKIVAPLFLAASKRPALERKNFALDESIPALFSDGRPPAELPPPPPPAEAVDERAAESSAEQTDAPLAEPTPEAPAAEPAPAAAAPAPAPKKLPESVGELFGQPHKQNWTPGELVAGLVTLPGVAGAVVALQEGLPVAASLPDGVKSEVVAAFLPQIFARLNQYSGEMRLGEVDDLLFTTHGAHCQIYRLGYIYFAVLGKAGEALPWHELHLITEELSRQTHK